jgi:hypothetical protein
MAILPATGFFRRGHPVCIKKRIFNRKPDILICDHQKYPLYDEVSIAVGRR